MSRVSQDPPLDRPPRDPSVYAEHPACGYFDILPPGLGHAPPYLYGGWPHHNPYPYALSEPVLPPNPSLASYPKLHGGRPYEGSWYHMRGRPIYPTLTDPTFYQTRRLPSPRAHWDYQQTLPPLSIPNLLNPIGDNGSSPPPSITTTTPSPPVKRKRDSVSSNVTTPASKRRRKSTKASEKTTPSVRQVQAKKSTSKTSGRKTLPVAYKLPMRPKNTVANHVVVEFAEVAAHTAKCDTCNHRNRDGMTRCTKCGWQCCRKCLNERGGNRSHKSFSDIHVPADETNEPTPSSVAESPALPAEARSGAAARTSSPSPVPAVDNAQSEGGMVNTAEDREAANALINFSSSPSAKKDPVSNEGADLDQQHAGTTSGAGEMKDDNVEAGNDVPGLVASRGWMFDYEIGGEEFENPRRNPSRRARPIDMAE